MMFNNNCKYKPLLIKGEMRLPEYICVRARERIETQETEIVFAVSNIDDLQNFYLILRSLEKSVKNFLIEESKGQKE